MSKQSNDQNIVPTKKKTSGYLTKGKRGAFAAVIISGAIIAAFVVYYLILGEESRKKNSLQLVFVVSKIKKNIFNV